MPALGWVEAVVEDAKHGAALRRGSRIFMAVFLEVWLGLLAFWAMVWTTLATTIW